MAAAYDFFMSTPVPHRPLRAAPEGLPRDHLRSCAHAWPLVSPSKWNAAQRERARYDTPPPAPAAEYTAGCPGCEDLIGHRQAMLRLVGKDRKL